MVLFKGGQDKFVFHTRLFKGLEVYRVLKKDGIYILSDSGLGGFGAWFDNNILFKLLRSGDCKINDRKGIEKILKNHKFKIIDSVQMSFMIYTVVGKK